MSQSPQVTCPKHEPELGEAKMVRILPIIALTFTGCLLWLPLPSPPVARSAPFPRQCTPAQTQQSFDCAQYRFELLATPNPGDVGPGVASEFGASIGGSDGSGRLSGRSRTECGCIQALAEKADWLADNNYTATVAAYCHCAQARN
jgi:hypothetical protein